MSFYKKFCKLLSCWCKNSLICTKMDNVRTHADLEVSLSSFTQWRNSQNHNPGFLSLFFPSFSTWSHPPLTKLKVVFHDKLSRLLSGISLPERVLNAGVEKYPNPKPNSFAIQTTILKADFAGTLGIWHVGTFILLLQ